MNSKSYHRIFGLLSMLVGFALAIQPLYGQLAQTQLPGKSIPKFVESLPTFVGARVDGTHPLAVSMEEFQQLVLPATMYTALPSPYNGGTYVWGYKIVDQTTLGVYGPHYPGFTVIAQRGTPTSMTYINNLVSPVLQQYLTVDQTLHWADPNRQMGSFAPYGGPIPTVEHLHGGEVPSAIDGGPDAWFIPSSLSALDPRGPAFNATVNGVPVGNTYVYPNTQEAATLWFHDHALGMTRLNVYGGLAAFYFLRGGDDTGPGNALNLPADPYEVEIAIQDRMFDTNGQLFFPHVGLNPTIHPYWMPEFFGDVIVVNGKTWPFMNVEPRRYRFRILNGSNARFYALSFGKGGPVFWQIGTDGGLLDVPVQIASPNRLLLAPGERADVIVDFTAFAGKTFVVDNTAKAPFPAGAPTDAQTGQIMQIRVGLTATSPDLSFNPALAGATLRSTPLVKLVNFATGASAVTPNITRRLTLNEVMGPAGPREILVNNTKWDGMMSPNAGGITELPQQGATELWEIINLTADAHPIHLHLVQFQLLNRQTFQANKYMKAYNAAFTGGVSPVDGLTYAAGVYIPGFGPPVPYASTIAAGYLGGNPDPTPFVQGGATPADPNERGWKDTFKMYPGQVTRVLVRYAPTDVAAGGTTAGTNYFAFDPTEGPGYVWHCHIIDHEDNEMMRPYKVQAGAQASVAIAARNTAQASAAETTPSSFTLLQNYPNPFNPTTAITYSLPAASEVSIRVYNLLGQEVATLVNEMKEAGVHTAQFNGSGLASGVYVYRMQAGKYIDAKKLTLVK